MTGFADTRSSGGCRLPGLGSRGRREECTQQQQIAVIGLCSLLSCIVACIPWRAVTCKYTLSYCLLKLCVYPYVPFSIPQDRKGPCRRHPTPKRSQLSQANTTARQATHSRPHRASKLDPAATLGVTGIANPSCYADEFLPQHRRAFYQDRQNASWVHGCNLDY